MSEFITILKDETAEIVEKKSKFIANISYVENVEEAEAKIKDIKKKYYDAKHNCIAYRVIENGRIVEKASDDGEPSGTAGGPMLNILQKNNLCNLVVVVTRYFGGILLGTGGLVRAYSDATQKAIEKSVKVSKVDGILFDIGVSSVEIDESSRGFSYMKNGPLDMRMDQSSNLTAEFIVNNYSLDELTKIFREYGEEKHSYKIAKKIIEEREKSPIKETAKLVEIIDKCYPYKEKRHSHPAKKVFQALRIEVNNELEELKIALNSSLDLLNIGGRLVVITFHSLEDRICKNLFKEKTKVNPVIKGMPDVPLEMLPDFKLVTNKPVIPLDEEMKNNSRSKSAKMRVIERVK